jgi:hypothetical protein
VYVNDFPKSKIGKTIRYAMIHQLNIGINPDELRIATSTNTRQVNITLKINLHTNLHKVFPVPSKARWM